VAPDESKTWYVWELAGGGELTRVIRPEVDIRLTSVLSAAGLPLVAESTNEKFRLWDHFQGRELIHLPANRGYVQCHAIAPDGRRLVAGYYNGSLIVWRVGPESPATATPEWTAREKDQLWTNLADTDAPKALAAMRQLIGARAVDLIGERLRKDESATEEAMIRLLVDGLDSRAFATRELSSRQLTELGIDAAPALRQVLGRNPSLEMRRRAEAILAALPSDNKLLMPGRTLREVRSVQVLELIGSPEARRLLEALAKGNPDRRLTHEAIASLKRLSKLQTRPE
jgi:hypothetical protein